MINQEGKKLIKLTEKRGWVVINGTMEGDKGEWTYHRARGDPVVDYVVANEEASEEIIHFYVEDRIESDHQPIVIKVKRREKTGWKEDRGGG